MPAERRLVRAGSAPLETGSGKAGGRREGAPGQVRGDTGISALQHRLLGPAAPRRYGFLSGFSNISDPWRFLVVAQNPGLLWTRYVCAGG